MQLTVRDVGKFLNVSESTITHWIKQRGLPAEYVGGVYRFNRSELLEWATTNGQKIAPDLFVQSDEASEGVPGLAAALEAGGIHYQVRDTSKQEALRAIVKLLPLPAGVDRDMLLQFLLAREKAASTAVGDGIAIPHVRMPIVLEVQRPQITLCFLEKPVDFGALDGKPVQVLFTLISPTTRSHLQLLSRLSFALHDARFKDVVIRQEKPEVILSEARRADSQLGTRG